MDEEKRVSEVKPRKAGGILGAVLKVLIVLLSNRSEQLAELACFWSLY